MQGDVFERGNPLFLMRLVGLCGRAARESGVVSRFCGPEGLSRQRAITKLQVDGVGETHDLARRAFQVLTTAYFGARNREKY